MQTNHTHLNSLQFPLFCFTTVPPFLHSVPFHLDLTFCLITAAVLLLRFIMRVVEKIDCTHRGMHDDICNIFPPMQKERKKNLIHMCISTPCLSQVHGKTSYLTSEAYFSQSWSHEAIHRKTVLPLFPSWPSSPFYLMGCYFQHRVHLFVGKPFKWRGFENGGTGEARHWPPSWRSGLDVVRVKSYLFSCLQTVRSPSQRSNQSSQQYLTPPLLSTLFLSPGVPQWQHVGRLWGWTRYECR